MDWDTSSRFREILAGFAPHEQSTALWICLQQGQKKPNPLGMTACANAPEWVLHQLVLAERGRRPSGPGTHANGAARATAGCRAAPAAPPAGRWCGDLSGYDRGRKTSSSSVDSGHLPPSGAGTYPGGPWANTPSHTPQPPRHPESRGEDTFGRSRLQG